MAEGSSVLEEPRPQKKQRSLEVGVSPGSPRVGVWEAAWLEPARDRGGMWAWGLGWARSLLRLGLFT